MAEQPGTVVLIIDDENAIRQSIRFYLEDYEYVVLEAENGRLGLERFMEARPDLVLVDLRMPEMDGLEVLSIITKESPDIPIIVMSGTGVVGDAVEALHIGAWDYLFKPFEDLTVLHHAIERALERARLLLENRAYQEHLEEQVTMRTQELEITSQELRKSKEDYQLLVENQRDMIVKLDIDGILLFASPAYCGAYGKTQNQLLGSTFMPMLHEEDQENVARAILKVYKPPHTYYIEYRALTVDGWRWQAWSYNAVLDVNGKIAAIVAVGRDITERKQAEAERERLEMAVEQAAEIIFITDTHGTITYVNPAFETITGYTREEVMGKNPRLLKSGKQDTAFYKELWQTITSGRTWNSRFVNRKKDGTLYTEDATITPIRSISGDIVNYVAVKRDITDELKLEAQLQMAQKMEAIASLTGGIAHDFNNLLTVINGHAEIAIIKMQKQMPVKRDIQAILQAGKRAENLTRQLLAFSRKQIFKPRIVDINQVIANLEQMLHRLISEDIKLNVVFGEDTPSIKADPGQIEQILMNLLVNARDAVNDPNNTRREKTITIETATMRLDNAFVSEHPGSRTGMHVCLAVSDNGSGMDAETLEKIFEPFFTTKAKGKGTGLGMSTVYGIVKQNDGSIYVYSEPGRGATFKIYWPSTDEEKLPDILVEYHQEELMGDETVLLVEDEAAVRDLTRDTLKQLGYRVHEAENGKIALQLLHDTQLKPHLLLTDLVMPEMDGKELSQHVKRMLPDTKILFASGYTDNTVLDSGELEAGFHFIQKPYSFQTLARKVRKILDR
jgi:PAS domain S-box-containing protein